MKVCKKCKKHVANKTKICKFCGADVSNCKIIKNDNNKNNKIVIDKNSVVSLEEKSFNNDSVLSEKLNIEDKQKNKHKRDKNDKKSFDKNKNKKSKKIKTNKFLNIKNKQKSKIKVKSKNKNKNTIINDKFSLECFNNKIKKTLNYKLFNFIKVKLILIILVLICCFGLITLVLCVDDNISVDGESENEISLDFSKDNLYKMGEVINYKGVKYKVLDVEISFGNNYKQPKDGNQFLIVTVSIFNDTDDKIEYSYSNWTMSNSKSKEDAKRIFTSINVDTALYSGRLVVGGVKKGSMVFEQPIDDEDIKLNFYELTEDKDGTTIIDKDKKVFSVKIDVPKDDNDNENKNEDKK